LWCLSTDGLSWFRPQRWRVGVAVLDEQGVHTLFMLVTAHSSAKLVVELLKYRKLDPNASRTCRVCLLCEPPVIVAHAKPHAATCGHWWANRISAAFAAASTSNLLVLHALLSLGRPVNSVDKVICHACVFLYLLSASLLTRCFCAFRSGGVTSFSTRSGIRPPSSCWPSLQSVPQPTWSGPTRCAPTCCASTLDWTLSYRVFMS
jgi:hypothetical protein